MNYTECRFSWSGLVDGEDSNSEVVAVNGVVQHGSVCCYWNFLILGSTGGVGDGNIVAQDGYPLQSEGRTPGD